MTPTDVDVGMNIDFHKGIDSMVRFHEVLSYLSVPFGCDVRVVEPPQLDNSEANLLQNCAQYGKEVSSLDFVIKGVWEWSLKKDISKDPPLRKPNAFPMDELAACFPGLEFNPCLRFTHPIGP